MSIDASAINFREVIIYTASFCSKWWNQNDRRLPNQGFPVFCFWFLLCFAFLIITVILKRKPEGRWWKKSPQSRCAVWESITHTSAVFIIQTTESIARYNCSWPVGMLNERLRHTVELRDPLYLSALAYLGTQHIQQRNENVKMLIFISLWVLVLWAIFISFFVSTILPNH